MKNCNFRSIQSSFASATALCTVAFASIFSAHAQSPVITSVSVSSAIPGGSVVIHGHHFNDTASRNIVFFGAAAASIAASSDSTTLNVTVPTGATVSRISVLNKTTRLTAYQSQPFIPEYDNSCFIPGAFNFKSKVDIARSATPTGSSVYIAVIADLDNDGKPDLVVADHDSSKLYVYTNTVSAPGAISTGSFTYRSTLVPVGKPTNLKVGDLDGDGRLDLILSGDNNTSVSVFRNTTAGVGAITFLGRQAYAATATTSAGLKETTVADFDGDGRLDIAVTVGAADSVSVLLNTITSSLGSGNFTAASFAHYVHFSVGSTPQSIFSADFNNDGLPDIVTGNAAASSISILRNTSTPGALSFATKIDSTLGSGRVAAAVHAADIDGDGKQDIIISHSNTTYSSNTISVFRNNASGGAISLNARVDFNTSNVFPGGLASGDLDGDGKIDIAVSNVFSNILTIYRNTATSGSITSGSLAASVSYTTGTGPIGLAIGDLDGDKKPDIVAGNSGANASSSTPNTNTISIFRNYPLPLLDTIAGSNHVCTGVTTTLTDATASGTWSLTNTTRATISASGVVTGISAGQDTAIYTLVCQGDTSVVRKALTIEVTPVAGTISGTTSVCVGSGITLSVSGASATGAWSSSNTSLATVNSGGVVTGLAAGTDTIKYTVTTTGCGSSVATYVVTVNPAPTVATISGSAAVCGGSTATYTNSTTGGTWSSSATGVATIDASTGVLSAVSAGAATITYSVSTTCGTVRATLPITVEAFPSAGTISATGSRTAVCELDSLLLTASVSGGTWSASNGRATVGSTTGMLRGITGGGIDTIIYSVSNSCGTSTAQYPVTINALPSAGTITGPTDVCVGTAGISLTNATTGGTWSSSAASIASVNTTGGVIGTSTGSATITYTKTVSGCTSSVTHAVRVSPLVSAGTISGTSTICPRATVSLSSSVSGGTWSSSNNTIATINAAGSLTGVSAGTDTVKYRVTNACSADSSFYNITVRSLPSAGTLTGSSTVCEGATLTLSSSVSGGTWAVSNATRATVAAGLVTAIAAGADTVYYIITNPCGADTARQPITINPRPSAGSITGSSIVCIGTPLNLSSSVTGGTWSVTNSNSSVAASGIVTGITPGVDTVMYLSVTACGRDSSMHVVTITPVPSAGTIAGASSVCIGSNITLSDTSAGGIWSTSSSLATISTGGILRGLSAGSVTVSYFVSNGCGGATATFPVAVNAVPSAGTITGVSTVCIGTPAIYTDTVSGGIWSVADTTRASIDASGVLTATSPGVDTIQYSVTTTCGTSIARLPVIIYPRASAGVITGPTGLCTGSIIRLTDTTRGGTWFSADTSIAYISGGILTGISNGTVSIGYAFNNACGTDTARYSVAVAPAPSAGIISGLTTMCIGGAGTLTSTVTGGTWTTSTPALISLNAATGRVTGLAAGMALITYTVTNSCGNAHAYLSLPVNPFPTLSSSLNPAALCSGTAINYTPTSTSTGASFSWTRAVVAGISNAAGSDTGIINETLVNTTAAAATVTYLVTTRAGGCSNTQSVIFVIKPVPSLSSGLTFNICSGTAFIYTAVSATAGTSINWTRASVTGVTPATGVGGSGYVNETLINSNAASARVIYTFTLYAAGCSGTGNVTVNVDAAGPAAPVIATRPTAWQCKEAMYQNFGAATTPPAGVNYTWSSRGGNVWATGSDRQYCIVNFPNSGLAYIYLTATNGTSSCGSKDSVAVYVDANVADHPYVTYDQGAFKAQDGLSTYQWGYDDVHTLDSDILAGETNVTYANTSPDFTNKYYWVITSHQWCSQKTYYSVPLGVSGLNEGVSSVEIFPNPSSGSITVKGNSQTNEDGIVVITDLLGRQVANVHCRTNESVSIMLDEPAGVYLVTFSTLHGRYTGKVTMIR